MWVLCNTNIYFHTRLTEEWKEILLHHDDDDDETEWQSGEMLLRIRCLIRGEKIKKKIWGKKIQPIKHVNVCLLNQTTSMWNVIDKCIFCKLRVKAFILEWLKCACTPRTILTRMFRPNSSHWTNLLWTLLLWPNGKQKTARVFF